MQHPDSGADVLAHRAAACLLDSGGHVTRAPGAAPLPSHLQLLPGRGGIPACLRRGGAPCLQMSLSAGLPLGGLALDQPQSQVFV